MIPKSEYQLILDPELNEGNKYAGLVGAVDDAQMRMLPFIEFSVRIIVNKKLADYFEGSPYQFTITYDNVGLPTKQRGIKRITFI